MREVFATHTLRTNGKTYNKCYKCGAWYQGDFGFNAEYHCDDMFGTGGLGLCRKCANRFVPMLAEVIEEIHDTQVSERHNRPDLDEVSEELTKNGTWRLTI